VREPRPAPPSPAVQVRTTKQYARGVCAIEPAWLPELAPAFFAARAGAAAGAVERRAGGGGGGGGG
jgi:ATP-dependent RNA helicase DHX8/PRP22